MAACLGLSGCTSLDLRGDGFGRYETANWSESVPTPNAQGDFFGVSNRSRQIEKNLLR